MNFFTKLFSHPLAKTSALVLLSVALVSTVAYAAASSLAPSAPPAPTSYSLNDIYNKLMYGTEATPSSGSLTAGGATRSISEVYRAVDVKEASVPDLLGQTTATGQTTSYYSGDDGTRQDGLARSYTDNGDGTVTDNNTGLMWNSTGSASTMIWTSAIDQCAGLTFAGYSDWYLPNINELLTLVDLGVSSGARINSTYFPNTLASHTWSSSTSASDTTTAWYVLFSSGFTYYYSKTTSFIVRCVRQS